MRSRFATTPSTSSTAYSGTGGSLCASRAFSVNDGWQSTYLNLAQTNLRAANLVVLYRFDLAELFRSSGDWGRVSVTKDIMAS